MDIEDYLLDGERVKKEMHTEGSDVHNRDWDWCVTSERVIKHGSGILGDEEFHDISLEKVSGISFESSRENALLGFALLVGVTTVLLRLLPPDFLSELTSIAQNDILFFAGLGASVLLFIAWYDSKMSYLQIHGQDSSDRWKIEVSGSAAGSKEVREFAVALRKEIAR
jgi:hypothetical protein